MASGYALVIIKDEHCIAYRRAMENTNNHHNNHRPRLSAKRYAPASVTVGFRLEEEPLRALAERAARLNLSPHELAREYVLEALSEADERRALREAVGALHQQYDVLREDMALMAEALLISAGKVSEKEARDWVKRNFESE